MVINEVRLSQVVLTPTFTGLLAEFGHTVRITGGLSVLHSDSRELSPLDLVQGFIEVGAVNFNNSTFASEQLSDAFLLHCLEVRV